MPAYLIDTNVMIAASAVQELSKLALTATPYEIELREVVYLWLSRFDRSDDRLVMDEEELIRDEYERNMPYNWREQEYGMQVLQSKFDRNLADYVPIEVFEGDGERIACLPEHLELLVSDREDRKWVACAHAAQLLLGEVPAIVYAAETDWFLAEPSLAAHGLRFCRLLPDDWYHQRVARK